MTFKSRYNLALFLSLLVWPGAGSFLLGRRWQGIFISLLATVSLVLLTYSFVGFFLGIIPIFGQASSMGLPLEETVSQIYTAVYSNPSNPSNPSFLPAPFGFSFFGVLIFSIILFLISWVYALIDLVMAKKNIKQGGMEGV